MKFLSLRLIGVLALALFVSNCSRNPVTGKREVMLMSSSQEQALGDQSDPSIVAAYGLYDDKQLQAFINQKGQEMAKVSHLPGIKYEFKVLDSPVVNAFALPGGYVYFTRGIMAHFNNEAEFAGVLGHEIGHITGRHSAKQYTKQMIGQVAFIGGIIASEQFRQVADQASQGLGLLFLKFGRDHESQSDQLGVEYSTKIGYDAHEMADFFQTLKRLQGESGSSIPTFMSTHPDPGDRFNNVHGLAEEWQSEYPNAKKVNREQYLNMIDGLVYGEDPRQGYTENGTFYHPELKFEFPYPTDWQIQNAPTMVQMAPRDGKSLIQFTLSQEKTLGAAANKLVEDAQLKVLDQKTTTINGLKASVLLADQIPQQQEGQQQQGQQQAQTIRILSYFIHYGQYIYQFNCMAASTDYNTYAATFKNVATKFKKLTDPTKLNVTPTTIKIQKAKRTGTLKTVLAELGVKSDQLNELAIVNGMQLSDQVKVGYPLKTLSK